jgi:hypothetical protein
MVDYCEHDTEDWYARSEWHLDLSLTDEKLFQTLK